MRGNEETDRKHTRRACARAVLASLALVLPVVGCGDGGVVFFSFTGGTVATDAVCRDGQGEFGLRDHGGLLIIVVINSDTAILTPGGLPGRCTDLTAGALVEIRGVQEDDRLTARDVLLQ